MNLANVNVNFLSLCILFCGMMIVFILPPHPLSKEEFAASSHEDEQSLLQFQVEGIRRPRSVSYNRDKLLMIFYMQNVTKHFLSFIIFCISC